MIRRFKTHEIREQVELDGLWAFSPLSDNLYEKKQKPDVFPYQLPVPGCWEQHPDLLTYRGCGVYVRHITLKETVSLRFEFKGVSHTADVYLDGEHQVHHYNAYTPFAFTAPDVSVGEHELLIFVDNRFHENSALHIPNDYYTYGGFTRPVVMEKISTVYLERLAFLPYKKDGVWHAKIKILVKTIKGNSRTKGLFGIKGCLKDRTLDFGTFEISDSGEFKLEKEFVFEDVKAWCHHDPQMYLLELGLYHHSSIESSNPMDDLIERVGFRTVEVQGQKLLVNGEPIVLKGFNRHEDCGIVGCAIPFQMMVKDLDLMEAMGANTVRTCHYPNDELFLDLCDERGFYVWEENHARGLSLERMQNPNFEKQCEDCIQEMIDNHFNHPAIMIWGILNECASDTDEGRRMYRKQLKQIRDLDGSRPITFASNKQFKDICMDLVDIVSLNNYAGWYNPESTQELYQNCQDWLETAGGKGKPVIISEFGAGGIYGYHDATRVKWTEERQADILAENLEFYLNKEEIVGALIWQFCDCRVTEEEWYHSRPKTKNNKGVVDEFRRPKLAYEVVKKYFKN